MNEWIDCYIGGMAPSQELRKAMDGELSTTAGKMTFYIALWFQHGNPLLGRCWLFNGATMAAFTDGTNVFTGKSIVGAFQVLGSNSSLVTGLDYVWRPFKDVASLTADEKRTCEPFHVQYISPCVLIRDGEQILGSVDLKREIARAVSYDLQKAVSFSGRDVDNFMVLCTQTNKETYEI